MLSKSLVVPPQQSRMATSIFGPFITSIPSDQQRMPANKKVNSANGRTTMYRMLAKTALMLLVGLVCGCANKAETSSGTQGGNDTLALENTSRKPMDAAWTL